ncbi:MAG: phosphoribosylformylglycinamidine cyclo-ligase [Thermodesulfatator sp.]|nr:MAG: phosphoribosylformylglycinamidine cyclo-ligase [Thermodesulfatator sp.]
MKEKSLYAKAGVDIEKANRLVERIKSVVSSTYTKGVITEIGGFAGLFALDHDNYHAPVLVSSTDGVGTKLKIAFLTGKHDTVGIDLVAMCVNDIVVTGAQPLFFLDYFATGRLSEDVATAVIKGIAEGCRQAGCALIGGETAEMPGMYQPDEYDLAGFSVGVVDRDRIIDGSEIGVGHEIIGINSSGLHSNGYSLVRKIFFEEMGLSPDDRLEDLAGRTIGEELLIPTRIYAKTVQNLIRTFKVDGIVHVTGGGFQDNIPRVLPRSCKAVIEKGSWYIPPVFKVIKKAGKVPEDEMLRTFNCGIGLILIVPSAQSQDMLLQLKALGEEAFVIGRIEKHRQGEDMVEFTGDELFDTGE